MNDDTKVLLKYALAIFLPVLFIIFIALIYLRINQPYEEPNSLINATSDTGVLQENDNFIRDLDALTLSLALPEGVLKRSFPERQSFVGGILQRYNHGNLDTTLKFSKDCLEKVLNDIDYWGENEEEFGTYEKYKAEDDDIHGITSEDIEKLPNDSFTDGYERFLLREMIDSNCSIKERLFYDNSIVYICESRYNKYIVCYDLYDDTIQDYKVVH